MTETPDYILATNTAYKTLIDYHEFDFPISIFSVLRKMQNVVINSYTETAKRFNMTFEDFYELASSDYGFSIRDPETNRYEIFYNDHKSETTIRFTLAHELGHIMLKHKKDGEKEDKEANCFARNYLCPIPVIIGMNIDSVKDYIKIFYISEPMAKASIGFRKLDYHNISSVYFSNYNNNVLRYMYGITINELYG